MATEAAVAASEDGHVWVGFCSDACHALLKQITWGLETWVIVRGVAEIEVNKNKKNLGRGENVFVARTITHRIKNISVVEPLEIIEVQTGDYLGEDDIERLEDDYGRI